MRIEEVMQKFPIGAKVRVVNVPHNPKWVGATGSVIGYSYGMCVINAEPIRPDLTSSPQWQLPPYELQVVSGGFDIWARRFK